MRKSIILAGILALGLFLLAGCRQGPEEGELKKKGLVPLEEMVPLEELAPPDEMAKAAPSAVPTTPAKPVSGKVDTDGDGIPDSFTIKGEPAKTEPEGKPAQSGTPSPDTIQVTDITEDEAGGFNLVINGSLTIKGFRKMSGQKGEWVAMPSYQTKGGEYKDLVYPVTREAKAAIQEAVLKGKKNPDIEGSIVVNEDKIKLYKSTYQGKTKAYGTMTINSSLALGIKVLEGQYGPWVALPSKKGEDGSYYDVLYPITLEATEVIKEAKKAILRKYQSLK